MNPVNSFKNYRLPESNHTSYGLLGYLFIAMFYLFTSNIPYTFVLLTANIAVFIISDNYRYKRYQNRYSNYLNGLPDDILTQYLQFLENHRKCPATENFLRNHLCQNVCQSKKS